MKDSQKIDPRFFLNLLGVAAATTALIGSGLKTEAQSHVMHEDSPGTHNMLVFGEKNIYLSHLPMFDGVTKDKMDYTSPHRYQAILAASFRNGGQDLLSVYLDDRRKNTGLPFYTLNPDEFVLPRLALGSPQSPLLPGFKAKVFRGHLEKGGEVVRDLDGVEVTLSRIVHFRKFNPHSSPPAELQYLLFGTVEETFLAHYISKPPDFDQILSVKVDGHNFTNAELGKGFEVTISGKPNKASERIKEAQQVTGLVKMTDATPLKFNLKAGKEIYFEEGELLIPPTFKDTPLEKGKD